MPERVRNLLPRPVREAWPEVQGALTGAVLFVDLSGFTQLSERLMALGPQAAEILTAALGERFAPMVSAVHQQGGFVAGFAGDAMTAVFEDGDESAGRALAAARLIRASVEGAVPRELDGVVVRFGVKIGVGWGGVDWSVLGQRDGARLPWFRGSGIDRAVAAEGCANPGDVVLHAAIATRLGRRVITCPVDDACSRLLEVPGDLPGPVPVVVDHTPPAVASAFAPAELLDPYVTGEFRHVVSVYLSLRDDTADDLEAFVQVALPLARPLGGYLALADAGDKGTVLLWHWGAPRKWEHEVRRAAEFLSALSEATRGGPSWRGALTHRRMFAGFVGSSARCQFSCFGGGVTLAARLAMAAPWGEVWLGPDAAARARSRFELEARGAHALKGYDRPVEVHALARPRLAPESDRAVLRGRHGELARLIRLADRVRDGRGVRCLVAGPAGVGKTRLVGALAERAELSWIRVACDALGRGAWRTLRQVASGVLGLVAQPSRAELDAALDRVGLDDPGRAPFRGLFGLPTASSWSELAPRRREAVLLDAVEARVVELATRRPVGLLVEDVHALDDVGSRLLERLTRRTEKLALGVFATARTESDEVPWDPEPGLDEHVVVGPLGKAAVGSIVADVLGRSPSPQLVGTIAERTAGNPLFVRQLALALDEQGVLVDDGTGAVLASGGEVALPDTVSDVLVARLDRQPLSVRRAVQAASILGGTFQPQVVARMLDRDVTADTASALSAQIWASDAGGLTFAHGLLRDAAQELLSSRRRCELHHAAARALEAVHAADVGPHLGTIADHYAAAGAIARALEAYREARVAARERFDWAEELRCSERALDLLPGASGPRELPPVATLLALDAHVRALNLMARPAESAKAIQRRLGGGEPAWGWAVPLLLAPGPDAQERLRLLANWAGSFAHARNAPDDIEERWEQVLRRAEHLGAAPILASVHLEYGSWLRRQGRQARSAQHTGAALEAFEARGAVADAAAARNNLAISLAILGRTRDAAPLFEKALAEDIAVDRWVSASRAASGLGICLSRLDRDAEAVGAFSRGIDAARRARSPANAVDVLLNLARHHLESGRVDDAERTALLAEARVREVGTPWLASRMTLVRAQVRAAQGHVDEAAADVARIVRASGGDHQLMRLAGVVLARVELLRGRLDTARDAAVELAEEHARTEALYLCLEARVIEAGAALAAGDVQGVDAAVSDAVERVAREDAPRLHAQLDAIRAARRSERGTQIPC